MKEHVTKLIDDVYNAGVEAGMKEGRDKGRIEECDVILGELEKVLKKVNDPAVAFGICTAMGVVRHEQNKVRGRKNA